MYLHYTYLLSGLPRTYTRVEAANNTLRADREKAEMLSEEAKLLGKYQIKNDIDLQKFYDGEDEKLVAKIKERQSLRNKLRRMHDSGQMAPIKSQIAELSMEIATLRKNVGLCRDIARRSEVILYVSSISDFEHHCLEDRYYAENHSAPRLSKKASWWVEEQSKLAERKRADREETARQEKTPERRKTEYER
ncbi:MAG: hypothetical protein HUJ86_04310 [Synergistes sp.]|nr:hypothetical protein [Synergistes sp.]